MDFSEEEREFQWETAFSPFPEIEGDDYHIFYWALFVPAWHVQSVWKAICQLTNRGELGYRSAKSPLAMGLGMFKDHFPIILDTPEKLKSRVYNSLKEFGLSGYAKYWKVRPRNTEQDDDLFSERDSEIVQSYHVDNQHLDY